MACTYTAADLPVQLHTCICRHPICSPYTAYFSTYLTFIRPTKPVPALCLLPRVAGHTALQRWLILPARTYFCESRGAGFVLKRKLSALWGGAGVIRSERWLAECAVARRKSGLFTVRFSGKVSAISFRSSTLSSTCHWTLPRCGLWHSSSFASGVLWEQSPHGLLGPGGVWTGSRLRFCLPTRCAIRSR